MFGLFLGDTDFSKIVLKKVKKLNKNYFIIDFSKNNEFAKEKNSHRISIGKFGKIINLIKEKKSNKVLFAGKIAKPKFSSLRLDLKGIYYMPSVIKAAKLGDAAIIKAIIKILNNEKIKVISSTHFNPELNAKKGIFTKVKPSINDNRSINRGIRFLNKSNTLDHVQALVVKNNKFAKEKNSYRISIGKFGKIINLIKEKKSNKVLFAGKIAKPKFSSLRLDLKGIYYMPSIIKAAKLGDAAIIKAIIKILNNEKIKVISSTYFNPELNAKKGNFTKVKPSINDNMSINQGIRFLNQSNTLDHVQALVVKDNKVIAKEGRQGTKKMLSKLKKNSGGILIKFPKKRQDLRMDLPTIGLQTLKDCKKYGLKGIVMKSKKNIFLDKIQCIKFANKSKIFISVRWKKYSY